MRAVSALRDCSHSTSGGWFRPVRSQVNSSVVVRGIRVPPKRRADVAHDYGRIHLTPLRVLDRDRRWLSARLRLSRRAGRPARESRGQAGDAHRRPRIASRFPSAQVTASRRHGAANFRALRAERRSAARWRATSCSARGNRNRGSMPGSRPRCRECSERARAFLPAILARKR